MAYKGRVGGASYMALMSRNSIALVWVMRMGGGNNGMIDSRVNPMGGGNNGNHPVIAPGLRVNPKQVT